LEGTATAVPKFTVGQEPTLLPIAPDVAEQFAEVSAQLIKKGKPIPTNDIWIAAIALAYGIIFVTSELCVASFEE
jgi:predicted nucleic acid-binding protein